VFKADGIDRSNDEIQSSPIPIIIIVFVLLVLTIPLVVQMYNDYSQVLNNGKDILHLFPQLAKGQNISHLPILLKPIPQRLPTSLSPITSNNNIKLNISSPREIHGIAGQFVKIKGSITTHDPKHPFLGGIAYISLVDNSLKIPVDLEDWSAEKGLYIPSVNMTQPIPLEWNVRLVKAGSYSVDILFNKEGSYHMPPIASSRILMEVSPKLNLNPGNVLPVAFGVPAVLITLLGVINYIRGKKTGVYS